MSRTPEGVDDYELNAVARRVLLDGLTALREHLHAITVVGAQAVYLRTEHSQIRSAPYTSDGDLGIDPTLLQDEPLLEKALRGAGFDLMRDRMPGLWARTETIGGVEVSVELDLLVGRSFTSGGRAARIQPHDKMAARLVAGLETSVVDRSVMTIRALDGADDRAIAVHVAGPAALLVSKAFKIKERWDDRDRRPQRLTYKDAGDVYRIMSTTAVAEVAASFDSLIIDSRVGDATSTGLRYLHELFGGAGTPGVRMAVESLAGDVPASRIRALAPAFTNRLPHGSSNDGL